MKETRSCDIWRLAPRHSAFWQPPLWDWRGGKRGPLEDGSAADATNQLKDQGHSIQLNLTNPYVPLSKCKVLGVRGLSGSDWAAGNVYVDVNCPDDDED